MKHAWVFVLAACGGGGKDDCEKVVDRAKGYLERVAKQAGKTFDADARALFVGKCREAMKEEKPRDRAMMKCVLSSDTKDDDDVANCIESPPVGPKVTGKKRPEAKVKLEHLMRASKAYYMEHGKFLVGTVPATPERSCCEGPDFKCPVNRALWEGNKIWSELAFSLDEPALFRYSYESDGTTVTAKAIGDLDCDQAEIEYVLTVKVDGTNPVGEIVDPSPNKD